MTIVSIARSAQTDANAFLKTLTNLGLNVDRRTDTTLHLEVFPNRPDLYSERTIRAAVRLYQKELIAPLPPIASRASCVSSEGPRQVLELYAPCVLSEQTQQDFEQLRSLLDRILGRQGKRFGISLIHLNDQRPIGAGVLHTETPLSRFYRFDAPDTAIRYEIGESTEWLADGTSVLCLIDGDNPKDLLRAATIIRRFLRDEQTTLYVNEPFASQMNDRFEFEYSHQSFEQSLGCVLDPSEIRELVRTDAQVNLVETDTGIIYRCSYGLERQDLLTPNDLIEELVIALGVERFEDRKEYLPIALGKFDSILETYRDLRELLLRSGFREYLTPALVAGSDRTTLSIQNPLGQLNLIAEDAIESGLTFLASFGKRGYPKHLFELKEVLRGTKTCVVLCVLMTALNINYTDGFSVLHLLFDQRARVKPEDDERFIPGRSGAVLIDALSLGMIGELHPSLLKRHEILSPVVAIEIELRG